MKSTTIRGYARFTPDTTKGGRPYRRIYFTAETEFEIFPYRNTDEAQFCHPDRFELGNMIGHNCLFDWNRVSGNLKAEGMYFTQPAEVTFGFDDRGFPLLQKITILGPTQFATGIHLAQRDLENWEAVTGLTLPPAVRAQIEENREAVKNETGIFARALAAKFRYWHTPTGRPEDLIGEPARKEATAA